MELESKSSGGLGWKVLASSAIAVALFSLIQIFFVYPRFIDGAIRDSESEAVQDARHMINMIPLNVLTGEARLEEEEKHAFRMFVEDFNLWKVKLFNADGKVVYSSDAADIGKVNTYEYFYNQVAKGEVFSKTVWQKEATMEGQIVPVDVVETYIPIMDGQTFLGAWEVYSDVTSRRSRIMQLIAQASIMTVAASALLLVAMAFLAVKTEAAFREKERLQEDLIRSDRLAAVGTLVSGIAHEFNNINVTVMGFSQLALEQEDLSPLLKDHLERINRASQRARTITNNLLDFSRQGTGTYAKANLVEVVREALALVKGQFEKEGVEFREALVPVPDSPMDRGQMVQVVLNIINNARHAMEGCDVKRLTIVTGQTDEKVFFSISDTGCGISERYISEIFTPFFTTKGEHAHDKRQAKIKGTGLGLSVSHTIVSNHGGKVAVESRKGEGTTFAVSLPVDGDDGVRTAGGETGRGGDG